MHGTLETSIISGTIPIAVASMRITRPKGPVITAHIMTRAIATPVLRRELFRPDNEVAVLARVMVMKYAQSEATDAMVRRNKTGGVSNPENAIITPFLILPMATKTAIPTMLFARVDAPMAAR